MNFYSSVKRTLGRFGFTPAGISPDVWGFHFVDRELGWYTLTVYLDDEGVAIEYQLTADCLPGDMEDVDITRESLAEILDDIRRVKAEARKNA